MLIQKSPPIDGEVVDNGLISWCSAGVKKDALTLFRKFLLWFHHVQACTTHGAEADETCVDCLRSKANIGR